MYVSCIGCEVHRTYVHVLTIPPGKSFNTNYFTVIISNHPFSKGLLEPWGCVCGQLHLPQLKEEMEAAVTLAVVAVTAATAAACVC
jgi:hypothetical protein